MADDNGTCRKTSPPPRANAQAGESPARVTVQLKSALTFLCPNCHRRNWITFPVMQHLNDDGEDRVMAVGMLAPDCVEGPIQTMCMWCSIDVLAQVAPTKG